MSLGAGAFPEPDASEPDASEPDTTDSWPTPEWEPFFEDDDEYE